MSEGKRKHDRRGERVEFGSHGDTDEKSAMSTSRKVKACGVKTRWTDEGSVWRVDVLQLVEHTRVFTRARCGDDIGVSPKEYGRCENPALLVAPNVRRAINGVPGALLLCAEETVPRADCRISPSSRRSPQRRSFIVAAAIAASLSQETTSLQVVPGIRALRLDGIQRSVHDSGLSGRFRPR